MLNITRFPVLICKYLWNLIAEISELRLLFQFHDFDNIIPASYVQ